MPRTTIHHLVPKQVGRRQGRRVGDLPTADLCSACHRMVHRLHENRALATRLSTLEALRADEEVARFLAWLRKQPPERAVRVR